MKRINQVMTVFCLSLIICSANAKLPAPTPEAKEATALAAAKTAHGNKVADYQLCMAQDKVARTYATRPKAGEKPVEVPACKDPGKFEPPLVVAVAPPTAPAATPAPATPQAATPTPPAATSAAAPAKK
jgi:hypothetical protein